MAVLFSNPNLTDKRHVGTTIPDCIETPAASKQVQAVNNLFDKMESDLDLNQSKSPSRR